MLTLGEVLTLCRRSARSADRLPFAPDLRARLDDAAAAAGEAPGDLVLDAVVDFTRDASPAEWSSLMARLRENADPGLAGLAFMVERSLRPPTGSRRASSED